MATKLEKLKELIAKFESVQNKHNKFGAGDTEPDGVFQVQLVRAIKGKEVNIPKDKDGWELYDMPGVNKAARSLASATKKCVDFIKKLTISEAGPVRAYLESYCWRCAW